MVKPHESEDLREWLADMAALERFAGDARYPELTAAFQVAQAGARDAARLYVASNDYRVGLEGLAKTLPEA